MRSDGSCAVLCSKRGLVTKTGTIEGEKRRPLRGLKAPSEHMRDGTVSSWRGASPLASRGFRVNRAFTFCSGGALSDLDAPPWDEQCCRQAHLHAHSTRHGPLAGVAGRKNEAQKEGCSVAAPSLDQAVARPVQCTSQGAGPCRRNELPRLEQRFRCEIPGLPSLLWQFLCYSHPPHYQSCLILRCVPPVRAPVSRNALVLSECHRRKPARPLRTRDRKAQQTTLSKQQRSQY